MLILKNKTKYKQKYEDFQKLVKRLIHETFPHFKPHSSFNPDAVVYVLLLILNHIPRWVETEKPNPDEISDSVLQKIMFGFKNP